VTVDLLTRLGVNVDYAAVDWGTVVARRTQKKEPGQGGWQMQPLRSLVYRAL
jgi:peptide/nickel transport system substrate-binding protein